MANADSERGGEDHGRGPGAEAEPAAAPAVGGKRVTADPVKPSPRAADDGAVGNGAARGAAATTPTRPAPVNADSGASRAERGRRGSAAARVAVRALLGLILLGASALLFNRLAATAPEAVNNPEADAARRVPVVVAARVPTVRQWQAFGTTRAVRQTTVAAEVSGRIVEKPGRIEEGASVEEGELLARLEADEYVQALEASRRRIAGLEAQLDGLVVERESLETRLELAEESVELSRKDLDRARRATEAGAGSPSELDRLRTTLNTTLQEAQRLRESLTLVPSRRANLEAQIAAERAQLRVAELNVERTEIRAPFAGRLQDVFVEEDERVAAGSAVARIVDAGRIEVPLRVAVSAASVLTPGDRAVIRPTGDDERSWRGEIVRVAPEADPEDRTVTVFAVVEQEIALGAPIPLKPGQFVTAVVESSGTTPRIVLPRRSVRDDDTVLVVAEDGRAAVRRVRPGVRIDATDGRFDELLAGETEWIVIERPTESGLGTPLSEGEAVIVSGVTTLLPGTPVQAAEAGELLRGMAPPLEAVGDDRVDVEEAGAGATPGGTGGER